MEGRFRVRHKREYSGERTDRTGEKNGGKTCADKQREEGVIGGGGGDDGAIIGIMISAEDREERQTDTQAGREDEGFDKSE
jgi:hypothetical protein